MSFQRAENDVEEAAELIYSGMIFLLFISPL